LGLAIAIVCLTAGLRRPADAGPPPSDAAYIALIERYQRGGDDAVASIAALDAKAIESGERVLIKLVEEAPPRGLVLLRAAIVAHTDAAITQRSAAQVIQWSPHLAAAERYVQLLMERNSDDPVALHWWFTAIGAMHAQRNYAQAMTIARLALRVGGERPEFLLAAGITNELAWTWAHEQEFRSDFKGSLDEAEKSYRRVLAREPAAIEARLRLGRILTLRGDNESAVRTLADVPDSAAPALVYLARLFEGDALERLTRTADARQRYDAAIRAFPQGQAAQLALAYSQYEDGARTDAAGRIHDSTSDRRVADDGDPWFWYSMGLGRGARAELEMLRAAVRR
jgi:tetratricopeptide (TPR) repeat protein